MTATNSHGPLRVGIGVPVGSGKTALTLELCQRFRTTHNIAARALVRFMAWLTVG